MIYIHVKLFPASQKTIPVHCRYQSGAMVAQEALRYKQAGRGFDF
jgi:hypothetical protein